MMMEKDDVLTLEICYMLIPLLHGLLSTDNDRYIAFIYPLLELCKSVMFCNVLTGVIVSRFLMTALELLLKLAENFGPIIHAARTSSPSIGVDLQAEQRCVPHLKYLHVKITQAHNRIKSLDA